MVRFFARACAILFAISVICASRGALAERVLVLPFTAGRAAPSTPAALEHAREATRRAVVQRGHTLPTAPEELGAREAVRGDPADTRSEYAAAGRAAGAAWTVTGHVEERGGPYRLELEVCLVATGRVESLAREVQPAIAEAQVAEMLGWLLRPEGVPEERIAWTVGPPEGQGLASAPAETPPVRRLGEGAPWAVGIGVDALGAAVRPSGARGSGASLGVAVVGTYALAAVPDLDLRAAFAVAAAGPQSARIEVGARWLPPVGARVRLGPELGLGALLALGPDKAPRFLARGAGVLAVAVTERVQVEGVAEVDLAAGGAGTLVLLGGGARGMVRF